MNVLLLSIGDVSSLKMSEHGVYTDLVRKIQESGHNVYVVCSRERRLDLNTQISIEADITVLRVKTGNITKTNLFEKGISTVIIGHQFKQAVKRYLPYVKFDLVLYSTPPITLTNVIEWIKKKHKAKSYLMLKDIFPQNAVDIGVMKTSGIKGLLYKYFRAKEKKLYALSDHIGCMSVANVNYIIKHNAQVDKSRVEVCPNCIEPRDMTVSQEDRIAMREKYRIPTDKTVFIYGGNLGKPQGIPFLIECLASQVDNRNAFFLVVGDGTEYSKLDCFINESKPNNIRLMSRLPKEDYERMVAACDVGMIFLDHRFTIPNFPSRLLSYMQAKLPVLCVTDSNTDIGNVAVEGGFGWWCESNDVSAFEKLVDNICSSDLHSAGESAWEYLIKNYDVEIAYSAIMNSLGE